MPRPKRDHNSSRSLVCLICWSKIFGNGGRILKCDDVLTCLIKDKYPLLSRYDPSDLTLPNGICSTCCRNLYKCKTDPAQSAPLIKACAHSDNSASAMHTRECSNASACAICTTAGQQGRPPSREPCQCSTCIQANNLPSTSSLNNSSQQNKPSPQFTIANLIDIQAKQNLSNNQIIKVATSVRSICGRSAVEPGLQEALTEIPKQIEHFYSSISANFKISDKVGYCDRVLVYCNDVEGLVRYILEARGYDPFNHIVRVGLDGGGGIFKIIFHIIDTVGLSASGTLKDTGVRRTIFLAGIEGIQENYENLYFILSKLKFD